MARFRFILNEELQYLHTKYFGELSASDLQDAIIQGNALYPDIDGLVDFSEASLQHITLQDVEWLAGVAAQHDPQDINCAFVTPENFEFGLARMYATIADTVLPQNRAIFRTVPEAEAWLREQQDVAVSR